MIDLRSESLMTFAELVKSIPRRRQNRPIALSTLHRWRQNGIRKVRLETVRVGGSWMTSMEAYHRFIHRVTQCFAPNETPASNTTFNQDYSDVVNAMLLPAKSPRTARRT